MARSAFSQLPEIKSKNKNELKFKKRLMTLKYTHFTVFYAFLHNVLENKKKVGLWGSQLLEIKSKNKFKLKLKKRLMTLKHTPFTVFLFVF